MRLLAEDFNPPICSVVSEEIRVDVSVDLPHLVSVVLTVGTVTVRLTPTLVVRSRIASSAALSASPPFNSPAISRLESPGPVEEPEMLLSAAEPLREAYGTVAFTHAKWPRRPKLCV